MEREKFLSSVYIIIRNNKNEILLQRRQGTKLWPGFLALPAGHIDENENAYDALIREAKEELDITVEIKNIINTFVANRQNKSLHLIMMSTLKLMIMLELLRLWNQKSVQN